MNNQKGFTIIEVLLSLSFITVALFGALSLLTRVTGVLPISGQRLTASYLAQEGIEIVRGLRDNNRIKILNGQAVSWKDGLTGCATGCEIDYNDSILTAWAGSGRLFKHNGFFFNYDDVGNDTFFRRQIIIVESGSDILEVSVEISWSEKNRSHTLSARENLYNW